MVVYLLKMLSFAKTGDVQQFSSEKDLQRGLY